MKRTIPDEPLQRCPAITFAGQPGHLLVRCLLDPGHRGDHIPHWAEADRNS